MSKLHRCVLASLGIHRFDILLRFNLNAGKNADHFVFDVAQQLLEHFKGLSLVFLHWLLLAA